MALTSCLYCGHEVSEAARQCPACAVEAPSGLPCQYCYELLKPEDGLKLGSGAICVHASCVDKYLAPKRGVTCPECKNSLADKLLGGDLLRPAVPCPHCGVELASGRCSDCGIPTMRWQQLFEEDQEGLHIVTHRCCVDIRQARYAMAARLSNRVSTPVATSSPPAVQQGGCVFFIASIGILGGIGTTILVLANRAA